MSIGGSLSSAAAGGLAAGAMNNSNTANGGAGAYNNADDDNYYMAKGGKQRIDNGFVRRIQNKECGEEEPCEWLRKLYQNSKDAAERRQIKQAMKRYNCDGKDRFR